MCSFLVLSQGSSLQYCPGFIIPSTSPESAFHLNLQARLAIFSTPSLSHLRLAVASTPTPLLFTPVTTFTSGRSIAKFAVESSNINQGSLGFLSKILSSPKHNTTRTRTCLLSTPRSVLRRRGSSPLFAKTPILFHINRRRTCLASAPRSPPSPRSLTAAHRARLPASPSLSAGLSAFPFFSRKLRSFGAAHRARSPPSPLSFIFLTVLRRGGPSLYLRKLRSHSL